MPTQLLFTRILNAHLAAPVDALLAHLHVHPTNPSAPISDTLMMELVISGLLLLYFVAVRLTLQVEKPSTIQHFAEITHEAISGQADSIIGHDSERYVSFLTVLAIFILPCNLVGLIPGLESPTASVVVPLGLALLTFAYYNYHGIRKHGFGYIKQFLGPLWWLSWLLFPIEVISHFARLLSLTVRLYANMFAGALITLVFFSLIPVGLPLVFMSLHLLVAGLQAFVFMLLAMIYLSMALSEEH
jgi:F-type H+-transporting ATPase subunit a